MLHSVAIVGYGERISPACRSQAWVAIWIASHGLPSGGV